MGFLSGLLGKSKNPADAAQPYLQQIAPMAQQNLNPYIQQGNQAGQTAFNQYNTMTQDPTAFLNDLFANYSMSEGFKNKRNEALRTSSDAARSGGYAGTFADQKMQAELADSLASQDMQQWLNNVLGIYGTGLEGLQGFQNQGFGASTDLTNILGTTLGTQGGLAFQGQAQKNQNSIDKWGNVLKGAGMIMGGPTGAAAGAAAGKTAGKSIW